MTQSQLAYNLPYEFRAYITDELRNYAFDYAMISTPQDLAQPPAEDEEGGSMELLAAACPVTLLEDARAMLRKAGLKLEKAAPPVSAWSSLIRASFGNAQDREFCILDIGSTSIRMYMFRGDSHTATHNIETGTAIIEQALAEETGADIHLARTYLLTNHEGCQTGETCSAVYNRISVELVRALNFYRFSNPESKLQDLWLSGGGADIAPLRQLLQNTPGYTVHTAADLLPDGASVENPNALIQAIGITLD